MCMKEKGGGVYGVFICRGEERKSGGKVGGK